MPVQLELPSLETTGSLRHALTWLLQYGLECSRATRHMHATFARYLLTHFGDRELSSIGYPELKDYYVREQARGLARETIRKRLSTLHMAMAEAKRQGWLKEVPPWPVIKTDSRPKDAFWTLEEWRRADQECDDQDFRTWVALGFWFGLHTADLNRFRWCDLDLVRGTWVRRCTKGKKQPETLPVPSGLLDFLRRRHDDLQPHPRDLVATRNMGHPNRPLKALCHRAGVPLISPIGLRHSCATLLEDKGTTERFQVEWLGHHSPKMLRQTYRHITPAGIDRGVQLLDDPPPPPPTARPS